MTSLPPDAPADGPAEGRGDDASVDIAALFLQAMPYLALAGPPRWLLLPSPPRSKSRVESVVMRAVSAPEATAPHHASASTPRGPEAPRTSSRAEPRIETAPSMTSVAPPARDTAGFPAPPPLTGFQAARESDGDEAGLEPSPWDSGFDPPKTAVGVDPNLPSLDPRMLSRNRPRRSTGGSMPAARVAAPTMIPKKMGVPESAMHDFIVLPQNPTFRAAEQGVNAVLTYLRTAQFFGISARHDLPDETVFDLTPDVFVHQLFTEGTAPAGAPSVLEGTLRVSPKPMAVPFGPPNRTSCFTLTFVGCRFSRLSEPFKARLHQIIYLRPEVVALPHEGARLRAADEGTPASIPAFDVREIDLH